MNATNSNTQTSIAAALVVAMSLTISPVAWSQTAPTTVHASGNVVMTSVEEEDGKTVAVAITGDDIKVTVDGEEVPEAQLKREGNQIIVTDKDGKRITAITVLPGGKDRTAQYFYNVSAQAAADLARERNMVFGEAQLIDTPKVMLGVHMSEPGAPLRRHLGLEPESTTMLGSVYEGLPAHQAGLGEYDIITAVDGESPAHPGAIRKVLAGKEPGDTVTFSVIQQGKPNEVTVTLAAYDREAMAKANFFGGEMEIFDWNLARSGEMRSALEAELRDSARRVEPMILRARERAEALGPELETRIRALAERIPPREELERQMEMLNERLAELEESIQKLLEREADE